MTTISRIISSTISISSKFIAICVEALFPLTKAERVLLRVEVENIWQLLPRAPFSSIPESCALFAYKDDLVSSLVWSLKYKKSKHAAMLGGACLYKILMTYMLAGVSIVVVPMPVSKQRRRERGFNQCELLLDEMEKLDSIRSGGSGRRLSTTRKLLVRSRHNTRQTLKDRRERLKSIEGIFSVNKVVAERLMVKLKKMGGLDGSNYLVIVIDDVVTTGSTMREAVHALRTAGLTNTYGLALAH